MSKNKLSLLALILLPLSVFAGTNLCVKTMDERVATLYACNLGEKFLVLSLDRCNITDKEMPAIVAWLEKHPHVTALDLSLDQVGDAGAQTLSRNKTLEWLSISYNDRIGSEGAKALANIPSLHHLHLTRNQVGPEGALVLSRSTHLKSLDLGDNVIGAEGAKYLAKNTSLNILYLDSNQIGDEGAMAFANNTQLTQLFLAENRLTDNSAISLAQNTRFTDLGLDYNLITSTGAIALAKNTTLRWLYLHNNHIGPSGIAALVANDTLIRVTYMNNDGTTLKQAGSLTYSKKICYNTPSRIGSEEIKQVP